MNRAFLTVIAGVVGLTGAWQVAVAADGVPARGRPALAPGRNAKAQPNALDQYQKAQYLFTGMLVTAQVGPTAQSYPPIHSFSLEVKVADVLRGNLQNGQTLTGRHSARQHQPPVLPVGKKCLFVAEMARGDRLRVIRIEEATQNVLTTARTAAALPLGWLLKDSKPVSPWSGLGKSAWSKEAKVANGQVACARTGRPALFSHLHV